MNLIMIIISSALISNVVLSRFLGICPFLGVSNKVETAKGMGLAVVAVIFVSTFVRSLPLNIELTNFIELLPLTLIIDIPPTPTAVEIAHIVSSI